MVFHSGNDNSFLQYLIFWESLETQHYEAAKLHTAVQAELDERQEWGNSGASSEYDSYNEPGETQDTMMNDDLASPVQMNGHSFTEEEKNEVKRASDGKPEEMLEYKEVPTEENAHLGLAAGPRDSSMTMPLNRLEAAHRGGNADRNSKHNSFIDEADINN